MKLKTTYLNRLSERERVLIELIELTNFELLNRLDNIQIDFFA
jgi:hypothetical protein